MAVAFPLSLAAQYQGIGNPCATFSSAETSSLKIDIAGTSPCVEVVNNAGDVRSATPKIRHANVARNNFKCHSPALLHSSGRFMNAICLPCCGKHLQDATNQNETKHHRNQEFDKRKS